MQREWLTEAETDRDSDAPMAERFRGYLPVVVDVETGGFDWNNHALLEIAAVPIELDEAGRWKALDLGQLLGHWGNCP